MQAVRCAGDLTLEAADEANGIRDNAVNGWGDTYMYRDWSTMYEFAYRYREGDDESGIL